MIFHAIPNSPPFHSFFVSSEFWNRKWSSCIQNSLNALDFRCRNDKQIGQRGCSVTTPLGKSGTSIVARNTKKYSQKTSRKWSWQMLIICWNLQFFYTPWKRCIFFSIAWQWQLHLYFWELEKFWDLSWNINPILCLLLGTPYLPSSPLCLHHLPLRGCEAMRLPISQPSAMCKLW